jgi:aryl-alcohol dehydrogenase-like predicted oxidoreductase
VLRELGIGFVPYSPLGRGFLTGTARPASEYGPGDMRGRDPRWQPGNYERNLAATAELTRLAAGKGATVSQLALAWVLTQGDDFVPIPGTRSADRVAENVAAAGVTLTADDRAEIDRILPHGAFGERYAEGREPVWE